MKLANLSSLKRGVLGAFILVMLAGTAVGLKLREGKENAH